MCVCVYCTHIVHSVERYHPGWSENELLTTQAMLTLHQTIQLFMKLNKMANLLLHCHRANILFIQPFKSEGLGLLRRTQTNNTYNDKKGILAASSLACLVNTLSQDISIKCLTIEIRQKNNG